jgi:general secretion pathway protein L
MARSSSDNLIIHALGAQWRWTLLDGQGRTIESGRCRPDEPDWPTDRSQVVLVDAAVCTGLNVELPEMPARRLEQALRWAAEEYLAGSAEDEHVVAGRRDEAGRLACVVIGREAMDGICRPVKDQPTERMVPDALCLPWQVGELALAEREGRILARWGECEFGSFELELAENLLAGLVPDGTRLIWYGGELPDWLDPDRVEEPAGQHSLDQRLAEGATVSSINLLSGPYSPRSAVAARVYWRWVAGLAAGLVLVAMLGVAIESFQLGRQADALQERLDERFAEVFPGITARGRHRELAERELARLRFGQAAGLLDLMNRTAPVIEGQDRVVLDAINYRDGVLELTLRAPDVAALDQLEQRLRALDLAADVRSASLDEDGASGRIRVAGGGR